MKNVLYCFALGLLTCLSHVVFADGVVQAYCEIAKGEKSHVLPAECQKVEKETAGIKNCCYCLYQTDNSESCGAVKKAADCSPKKHCDWYAGKCLDDTHAACLTYRDQYGKNCSDAKYLPEAEFDPKSVPQMCTHVYLLRGGHSNTDYCKKFSKLVEGCLGPNTRCLKAYYGGCNTFGDRTLAESCGKSIQTCLEDKNVPEECQISMRGQICFGPYDPLSNYSSLPAELNINRKKVSLTLPKCTPNVNCFELNAGPDYECMNEKNEKTSQKCCCQNDNGTAKYIWEQSAECSPHAETENNPCKPKRTPLMDIIRRRIRERRETTHTTP